MLKFFAIVVLVAITASVQSLEGVLSGRLPSPRSSTAAFYDNENGVYILGGRNQEGALDEIVRYDLNSEEVQIVANFQHPISDGGIGTDGKGKFFYIGGRYYAQFWTDSIWELTTQNPVPKALESRVPHVLEGHNVASDLSGRVHVTGGRQSISGSEYIYHFDANTMEFTNSSRIRREVDFGTASFVKDEGLYLFGGRDGYNSKNKFGQKFDPVDGSSTFYDNLFPGGLDYVTSVTVGKDIYLIGGTNHAEDKKLYLARFNTGTEKLERLEVVNVSMQVNSASAVYIPTTNRIYVFGGFHVTDSPVYRDGIFYIQL